MNLLRTVLNNIINLPRIFRRYKRIFRRYKIIFCRYISRYISRFSIGIKNNFLTLLFSLSLAGGLSIELSIFLRELNLEEIKTFLSNLPFNSVELSVIIISPVLLFVSLLKLPRIKKRFKVSIASLSFILFVFVFYIIFCLRILGQNEIEVSNLFSLILFYLSFNIVYIIIELILYLYKQMYSWLLDTNTTIEPAKLTLIWTIIAFILGMFISKK